MIRTAMRSVHVPVVAPVLERRASVAERTGAGWGSQLGGLVCAVLVIGCSGCGGDGEGDDAPGDVVGPGVRDGRVWVDNRTGYALDVAYLNDVDPGAPIIVRTRVEAGDLRDVTGAVLPAGTEIELDVVLLVPESEGFRVRRKAQASIDGDVVITAQLEDPGDPFSVTFATTPTPIGRVAMSGK